MEAVVLRRVGFLAYSFPKQGQDFKLLAAPLHPNMDQLPPTRALIRISKSCVVVSFEVNRRCSLLFHSLIDRWTRFSNLRLLLVYQSVMLEFIHLFPHKRCQRNSYWYFNLQTVTTNLPYLSEILWCSFRVAAAALSSLNKKNNKAIITTNSPN